MYPRLPLFSRLPLLPEQFSQSLGKWSLRTRAAAAQVVLNANQYWPNGAPLLVSLVGRFTRSCQVASEPPSCYTSTVAVAPG